MPRDRAGGGNLGRHSPTDDERLSAEDQELVRRQQRRLPTYQATGSAPESAAPLDLPTNGYLVPEDNTDPPPFGYSENLAQRPRRTPYGAAAQKYRDLSSSPVEDGNGRFKSGLHGAAKGLREGARSGDLGFTLGSGLGAFFGGLINKKHDEEGERERDLSQAQRNLQVEGGLEQQGRAREQAEADLEYKRAQTEKARRAPVEKPVYRKQGGLTYRVDGETATPIVGPNGEALLPDAQRQVFIDTLGDDGVSVTRNVYNPQTGKYEPVQINGAAATVKRVPRVSVETGMTAAQEAADADRDAALVQRRQLEELKIKSRESIAAANRAIQRDRQRLSAQNFATKYPGYGKTLTKDAVLQKAKQLDIPAEDVMQSAVRQGYAIKD